MRVLNNVSDWLYRIFFPYLLFSGLMSPALIWVSGWLWSPFVFSIGLLLYEGFGPPRGRRREQRTLLERQLCIAAGYYRHQFGDRDPWPSEYPESRAARLFAECLKSLEEHKLQRSTLLLPLRPMGEHSAKNYRLALKTHLRLTRGHRDYPWIYRQL